jgi:hypothetical protein
MYTLGRTIKYTARLFSLMARVRVNVFRLTLEEGIHVPHEVGYFEEPSRVIERQIRSDVTVMRDSIAELVSLHAGCQHRVSLEKALLATNEVLESVEAAMVVYAKGITWKDVVTSPFGGVRQKKAWDNLALDVRAMETRIQAALDELAQYVQNSMPIAVSDEIQRQIQYDQIRQSPQGASQLAFALLEDHLRRKIGVGSEVYGEDLINAAFGRDGRLIYSRVPAEQIGVRNLLSGAYATLRNPRMHKVLEDDESTALTIVALTDLLCQLIDRAESR